MDVLVPIVVQLIAGGAGGSVLGQLARSLSLGPVGDSIVGAIGGVLGTFLTGLLPNFDTLLGASSATSAMDLGALAGQGAVALIIGGALTAMVGTVKSFMVKGRAMR
ncbi:hypothetical protein [Devosia sp. Leaf64]|uniref:hypothetical protein n=1 Tax=Devosia sp. Leaf64 TaxID=1736229 RepID=UPI0007149577|nr:hypothetical protein [Devosia sp. Leaf64]KQN70173.1 hypothetical protein ASE94_12605 [Devosia sp. Leaf64]